MIKVNELRIGNFVCFNGRPVEVWSIHKSKVMFSSLDGYIDLKNVFPFEISKIVLNDFGFFDSYGCEVYQDKENNEIFKENESWYWNSNENTLGSFKFVHEFQNLYYILKKKELKIRIGERLKYHHLR